MDAQYVKGMLTHPEEVPSYTMNRWMEGILRFNFTLVHVPKERLLVPNALSGRPRVTGDESDGDTEDSDRGQEYDCPHLQFGSANAMNRTCGPLQIYQQGQGVQRRVRSRVFVGTYDLEGERWKGRTYCRAS